MSNEINSEWRLDLYDGFLNNEMFELKKFQTLPFKNNSKVLNDHEHCIFCWKTITDLNLEEEHDTEGYCCFYHKTSQFYWICKDCFNDFKIRFQWKEKYIKNGNESDL